MRGIIKKKGNKINNLSKTKEAKINQYKWLC